MMAISRVFQPIVSAARVSLPSTVEKSVKVGRLIFPKSLRVTHEALSRMKHQAMMNAEQLGDLRRPMFLAMQSKFGKEAQARVLKRFSAGLKESKPRIKGGIREGREMLSDVKGEMAISGGHAGLLTRFKSVMAEYGRVAVCFHTFGVVVTTSSIYVALTMGLNVDALMEYLPAAIKSNMSEEMGTLALSLILCELTAPPRYALTIVAAPKVAERIRDTKYGMIMGLTPRRKKMMSLSYLPGRHARENEQKSSKVS